MLWRDAVLDALHRFSARHGTRLVDRQSLISEEMDQIVRETGSQGQTPEQTLSRVLQELQSEQALYFTSRGKYFLLDSPVNMETEELPEDAVDFAIKTNKLFLGIVPTADAETRARRRKGQERVRALALQSYDFQCGVCDVADRQFLVASHIARWADEPQARGDLSNVICLCRLHDPLFEAGYFTLSDSYDVVTRNDVPSQVIVAVLKLTRQLRVPYGSTPSPMFLKKHRIRTGFERA